MRRGLRTHLRIRPLWLLLFAFLSAQRYFLKSFLTHLTHLPKKYHNCSPSLTEMSTSREWIHIIVRKTEVCQMPHPTCYTPLSFILTPERIVYSSFSWGPKGLCPRALFILQAHCFSQKIIYYLPKIWTHPYSSAEKKRAEHLSDAGVVDNYTVWFPAGTSQMHISFLQFIRLFQCSLVNLQRVKQNFLFNPILSLLESICLPLPIFKNIF